MLADAEDEGVVEDQVGALRLCNVEVVALRVWCWMQCEERVWRVTAGVRNGKTDG